VLGQGERLFADLSSPVRLARIGARDLGDGLAHHRYRVQAPAEGTPEGPPR
jgi:hypothetical protein